MRKQPSPLIQPEGGIEFLEPLSPFHQLLSTAPLFGTGLAERDVPPRIPRKSRHHTFAVLVLTGYPYEEACQRLDINPRTAERWRTDLRRWACAYFGRTVTYEYAARVALDSELRHLCEHQRVTQQSVRGSPQQSSGTSC